MTAPVTERIDIGAGTQLGEGRQASRPDEQSSNAVLMREKD